MKIEQAIEKQKAKLRVKANRYGLYENFGQDEVRKISEKFIDSSNYSEKMNQNRRTLASFDEWCMTYDIERLNP